MKRLIPLLVLPLLLSASHAEAASKGHYRAVIALAEQNKKTGMKALQEMFNIPQSQVEFERKLREEGANIVVRSNGVVIFSQEILDGKSTDKARVLERARQVDDRIRNAQSHLAQLRIEARGDRHLMRTVRKLQTSFNQMQARSRAILRLLR